MQQDASRDRNQTFQRRPTSNSRFDACNRYYASNNDKPYPITSSIKHDAAGCSRMQAATETKLFNAAQHPTRDLMLAIDTTHQITTSRILSRPQSNMMQQDAAGCKPRPKPNFSTPPNIQLAI
eukprot:TRINITY_DN3271_c0_g1_i1.p1 TRINITY_DN3271_c0_g1~~TRINITY_DN3271_c0_g1_i1.p1  ORF type:complete len:123 (+),score=17.54 TRINITY_DN3271_c0_g1_i1:26-394(+)